VSILFAWLLFPDQGVSRLLTLGLSRTLTHITLDSGQVSVKPPMGLTLKGSEIVCFDSIRIRPDTLTLGTSFLSILNSDKDINFDLTLGTGHVKGQLRNVSFSRERYSGLAMAFSKIAVKEFAHRANGHKIKVSFNADGQYDYDNERSVSSGNISLSQISVSLPPLPKLTDPGLSTLEFNRLEIEFTSEKNEIKILQFRATGPVFNIEVKGKLSVGDTGSVHLKGYIRPDPSMIPKLSALADVNALFKNSRTNKGIAVSISGTIMNPLIRFQ